MVETSCSTKWNKKFQMLGHVEHADVIAKSYGENTEIVR